MRLRGLFRCLDEIELSDHARRGTFRISDASLLQRVGGFLTPAVLFDGLIRFSMIHLSESGGLPVYVPLSCGRTRLRPHLNDRSLFEAGEALTLRSATPRPDGERVTCSWAEVRDSRGRVLIAVENLVAHRVGEIPQAEWEPVPA